MVGLEFLRKLRQMPIAHKYDIGVTRSGVQKMWNVSARLVSILTSQSTT
jgi:hypothetical protein